MASSQKRTSGKSVLKHAKAVLTRLFEEVGWTGAWSCGARERAPEGNSVSSRKVRDAIQLRRDAAAREGIVPVNVGSTEYQFLGRAFRALQKDALSSTDSFDTLLRGSAGNRVGESHVRDLRAYFVAVLSTGTLSCSSELSEKR